MGGSLFKKVPQQHARTLQKTEAFTVIQCQVASSVLQLVEEYQI